MPRKLFSTIAITLIISILLTIFPFVSGDESSPEIRDKDYEQPISGNPLENEPLVQQANIDSAWFGSETVNSFETTIKVKRLRIVPLDLGIGGTLRNVKQLTVNYYVSFKNIKNSENYFTLATVKSEIDLQNFQNILPHYNFSIIRGTPGNIQEIFPTSGTVDNARNTISVLVPKSIIGNPQAGDRLNETYAETKLEVVGGGILNLDLLEIDRDRAGWYADDNFGQDYVFKYSATKGTIKLDISGVNSKSVSPGDSATYLFKLTNTGEKNEVRMNSHGTLPTGWSASFDKPIISIDKNSIESVKLTVKTSSSAKDGENVILNVYGNYTEDGKTFQTSLIPITTIISIQQNYSVSLTASQSTKKCSLNYYITFPLIVKNEGRKEDTISISIEDKEGDLIVEVDKTEVRLESKKSETINVKVSVPKTSSLGNFNITIKATSTNDSTKFAEKILTVEVTDAKDGIPLQENGEERGPFDMNKILSLLLLALIIAVVIVAYAVWRRGRRKEIAISKVEEFKEVKKVEKKK